jgi:hypothetical protein
MLHIAYYLIIIIIIKARTVSPLHQLFSRFLGITFYFGRIFKKARRCALSCQEYYMIGTKNQISIFSSINSL